MLDFFVENAGIIAAFPLWIFLIIIFGRNLAVYDDKRITMWLTCGSTFIGLIWSLFILFWTFGTEEPFSKNITWLSAGDIRLSVGWLVDNMTALMLLVVTSVSLLIQVYSHGYMHKDSGYHRFFAYLNLFNFSMLGLVLSSNLFQIYIFWELVGVSSYLLIGFWYTRPSAANAATKAFIINRIGDFGLLVGIIAFLFFSFAYWADSGDVYLSFTSLQPAAEYALSAAGPGLYFLIALAVFMGPIAKSAQFPLHTWLPDAMEGPTPISALIHAATMVAAGVYLIARVYPIFEISPEVMTVIAWVGALTALLTAIIAVTQTDIKKTLAYSTCSQLGYMVMAMGAGAMAAGMFHLTTHAFFKAMLFLCSGAVIHGLSDQQDMRYMGGLRKHMPVVAYTYLIGCLAISGLLLSGFWSKEKIFTGLYSAGEVGLLGVALFVALLTSFYMFKSYFLTFEGEYRGKAHPHNAPKVMTVPLIILAVPSVLLGFVPIDKYIGHAAEHHGGFFLVTISLAMAFAGLFLAKVFYNKQIKPMMLLNMDTYYYWFIDKMFLPVTEWFAAFDKYVVDGIVNFIGWKKQLEGWLVRQLQTGQVQSYLALLFSGLVGLMLLFVLIHWIWM